MQLDRVVKLTARIIAWGMFALLGVATVGYILGGIWVLSAIW